MDSIVLKKRYGNDPICPPVCTVCPVSAALHEITLNLKGTVHPKMNIVIIYS